MGDLAPVVHQWIAHFRENSGNNFYSTRLNQKVAQHKNTVKFIQDVKAQIHEALNEYFNMNENIITVIQNSIQYKIMDKVRLPKFTTLFDHINGLGILIHDIWAVDIELTDYHLTGRQYSGQLKISMVDHFGLDDNDVSQSEGKGFHYLNGFRSWYILQHYQHFAFHPFKTKLYLDVTIEGEIT